MCKRKKTLKPKSKKPKNWNLLPLQRFYRLSRSWTNTT